MGVVAAVFLMWTAVFVLALAGVAAASSLLLRWFASRRPALSLRAPGLATFAAFALAPFVTIAPAIAAGPYVNPAAPALVAAACAAAAYVLCVLLFRRLFRFEEVASAPVPLRWEQAAVLALLPCAVLALVAGALFGALALAG